MWQVGDAWPGPSTSSGVSVSPDTALRLSAVWACVRIIADTVSTLPYLVFDEDTLQPVKRPTLLVRPAAWLRWHQWVSQIMWSVLLTGAAAGIVVARSGAGLRPSQIELVSPDRVTATLRPDRITHIYRFDGREVERNVDLWYFPGHLFPGQPAGLSPVRYHAETVGLGIAAQRYGASFFGSEARPAGVLATDGSLTDVELAEMTTRWREAQVGTRRTAVLEHGVEYKPIAVPPEEAQFLETAQLNTQQICAIYGVPPEMVASSVTGTSVTYSNVEQRPLDLLKFGVGPWLIRLQAEFDDLLPPGTVGRFDPAGLLKADQKSRFESYQVAIEAGFLTPDEVRAMEDRPPLTTEDRRSLDNRPALQAVS